MIHLKISRLDGKTVMELNEADLARLGGAAGLRDEGLLLSALSRPLNA